MNSERHKNWQIGRRLLDLLLATHGLPGWVCVGHPDPQAELQVFLETPAGTVEITRNHAIVSLKPLTVAIGIENTDLVLKGMAAKLVIREPCGGGSVLGHIKLRLSQSIFVGAVHIYLFQTLAGRNLCVPTLRRETTYLYERWKMSKDKDPHSLHMVPSELFSMWILHDVPRPVFLVSYGGMTQGNMFPMDLLGPLSTSTFVLGLHSTSPAIPIWQRSRQIVASAVPLRYKPTVYAMGKNHRQPLLDPSTLPVPYGPSKSFQIPVPAEALSVRELNIEQSLDLGSHVLFVACTHSMETRTEEPQMCHIHRFYQQFLMRQNSPLPSM